ncbi:hypothetical protein BLA18112_05438 [Burkholderia lata]|uniref:DUF4123 domain-containing protein n=1 Tax=Burkholderia lata (strain ATCC 17760 / DSM 23089 / LMG 22485 / NCIMB 9086 / R18194 / 383) TaxID=482957 RepID=A0A6P2YJE5_BURL3|nr:DUF4123 domain-containing protein [Burkholderia lata]VWD22181.1 hypothetical protein BLA18112_05438 [Burkholderia lata]
MTSVTSMKPFHDLTRALPLPAQWPRTSTAQRHDDLRDWHRTRQVADTRPLRLLALVDGALDDTMLDAARWRGIAWQSLYPATMLESSRPEIGPFLLDLTADDDASRAMVLDLLNAGSESDLVVWLATGHAVSDLAAYLHPLAEATLPDTRQALLRYYDPSILENLLPVLTAAQRRELLATFVELRYRFDPWESMVGEEHGPLPAAAATPVVFTDAQYEALAREGFAETLYFQLHDEFLPPMSAVPSRWGIRYAKDLVTRARTQHGLANENDLAYFVLVGMNVHPAFDAHPAIAEKIAARGDDPPPLAETLADVDADVWAALLDAHPLAGYAGEPRDVEAAAVDALPDAG